MKALIKLSILGGEFRKGPLYAIRNSFGPETCLAIAPINIKTGNPEPLVFGLDIEKLEAQPGGGVSEISSVVTLRDGRRFMAMCQHADFPDLQAACLVAPTNELTLEAIRKWRSPEEIAKRTQAALISVLVGIVVVALFVIVVIVLTSEGSSTPPPNSSPPSIAPGPIPKLLDVPGLFGKTQQEVGAILGKPTCQTENISRVGKVPTCTYDKGAFTVEVTFIKKKADWISVEGLSEELAYEPDAITALGFPRIPGYTKGPFSYSWSNAALYHELTIFGAGDRVNYIYVKAVTD